MNESVTEGAWRELKEETGWTGTLDRLHSVYTARSKNQVVMHFLAQLDNVDFTLNDESVEIQLFDLDAIPWDKLAFKSNTFALENYLKTLDSTEHQVFIGESDHKDAW